MRNKLTTSIILALLLAPCWLAAQGTQQEFGKNRVQYHEQFSDWMQYESRNFITYWYGEGRSVGQTVVQLAEYDYEAVQGLLEHRMNDRIEIIVYKDLTDLKQSNIGSEEAFVNTGGQTKIVGNKIFVYFNGDHNHLRRQIREGIASVYINAMLFGSNLQEIVQNAVMLNLPEWFKTGLVSYVGKAWDTDLDNQLRDIILRKEYKNFDRFAEDNPQLAGHSMWYYISQNYGRSTVSNLLYLTRINRSIESGFLYVLGSPYERTVEGWERYFQQRYEKEVVPMQEPAGKPVTFKNKRKLPITDLKLSPDGQQLVYVLNEIGKYKVYLHDLRSGDRRVIHKGGFRNAFQATDYDYPMVAWNPNNMEIAILYEPRDQLRILRYDVNTKETVKDVIPDQYHRVYSIDYVDVSNLVFSASVRGISDLFVYSLVTRQTQRLTNDFWDDLDATVVHLEGRKGILFASNRGADTLLQAQKLDSILPINDFDLYFYDYQNKSSELVRVTATPLANERQPEGIDSTWFAYLSDESGIYNRRIGFLDSVIAYYDKIITLVDSTEIVLHMDSTLEDLADSLVLSVSQRPVYKLKAYTTNQTNYDRNILVQSSGRRSDRIAQVVYRDEQYQVMTLPAQVDSQQVAMMTRFQQQRLRSANLSGTMQDPGTSRTRDLVVRDKLDRPAPKPKPEPKKETETYLFQSEFDDDDEEPEPIEEEDTEPEEVTTTEPESDADLRDRTPSLMLGESEQTEVHKFRSSRIVPYRLKFRTDFVTTQLDNSLLFGGLDSYAGTRQEYNYPPPGILLKANFKDLFEDYEFEGGIRVPTTFNGAEYFLVFDDKKKRLDKRYALYRRALKFSDPGIFPTIEDRRREIILLGQYQLRYPLDIFRSVRATFTLRGDKTVQLATSRNYLEIPTISQQRAGVKLEYVFDNTLDVSLNIKNGTRYKFYGEVIKRFVLDITDEFVFDLNEGFMTVLGFDARHYQRLDKHSILALRAAGATSFGREKILYFLGGVDNWLFPSFNNDIPFPSSGNFAYQTLAANMRGFRQNIRNGNSFALINAELRVPMFRYLFRRTRSSFFRNFQAVGFFDMGTAWPGKTPFADENPLNTIFINLDKVNVKVNYFRDPIVAGYGFGIRSVLFGYFVRIDYAWGIETRVVQDPRLYLSIGMDF